MYSVSEQTTLNSGMSSILHHADKPISLPDHGLAFVTFVKRIRFLKKRKIYLEVEPHSRGSHQSKLNFKTIRARLQPFTAVYIT